MLNKMIKVIFVVVLAVTPLLTVAGGNVVSEVKNTSSAIGEVTAKGAAEIKVAKVEQELDRSTGYQQADKKQTSTPISGWLLFSALLGFVMLSNRMTV